VIRSFGDAITRALFEGEPERLLRRLPPDIRSRAETKLDVLNNATSLGAIDALPGTRLEPLQGVMEGHFSIRVNRQWRLVFRWDVGDAVEVRLMDYHE
jgi:proteic killer suppression protein